MKLFLENKDISMSIEKLKCVDVSGGGSIRRGCGWSGPSGEVSVGEISHSFLGGVRLHLTKSTHTYSVNISSYPSPFLKGRGEGVNFKYLPRMGEI